MIQILSSTRSIFWLNTVWLLWERMGLDLLNLSGSLQNSCSRLKLVHSRFTLLRLILCLDIPFMIFCPKRLGKIWLFCFTLLYFTLLCSTRLCWPNIFNCILYSYLQHSIHMKYHIFTTAWPFSLLGLQCFGFGGRLNYSRLIPTLILVRSPMVPPQRGLVSLSNVYH